RRARVGPAGCRDRSAARCRRRASDARRVRSEHGFFRRDGGGGGGSESGRPARLSDVYFELRRNGIDPEPLTLDQMRLYYAAAMRARARDRLESLGDLVMSQASASDRKKHAK